MKKEFSYFSVIITIFAISTVSLLALIRKYSFLTLEHLVEVCKQVSADFFASGFHHVGFILSAIVLLSMFIFLAKTIFSFMKTRKKVNVILKNKRETYPHKLCEIIKNNNIQKDWVIIVQTPKDVAITINWFGPKIILSNSLIQKLTTKELESVVLHEFYHAKFRHPLFLAASEIITATLFFIPILKDINNKLKFVLEEAADEFAYKIQGSSTSLNLALSKVDTETRFEIIPSFSRRTDYELSKKNKILTLLVVLVGLVLYFLPTQVHASQDNSVNFIKECGENQCSIYCNNEDIHEPRVVMSLHQSSFSR